jgi:beta-phosphoglucomutase-like phosphatase (HAD superfamily)
VPRSPETALVFDLDGVLVDTAELVTQGWLRFAASRGRRISRTAIRDRLFGRRTIDILHDEFGLTRAEAASLVAAGIDDKTAEVAEGPPLREVPGARRFVRHAIEDGTPVALVSSASASNVALALEAIGLRDAFHVTVDAGRIERGKPAPDPYLAAARALGLPPSSLVVFEDSVAGIAAAMAAGARCVGIASSLPRERLATADLVIDDLLAWTPATVLGALAADTGPVSGPADPGS